MYLNTNYPQFQRLLRIGIRHKGEVFWSPPILVHNSVFSPLEVPTSNEPSGRETSTTINLTASGKFRHGKSIGKTPADAVVNLNRDEPLFPISIRLGGIVCSLALRLTITERSANEVVSLSIEPLVHLHNRSNRPLLCKPIIAPDIGVQQSLPIVSVFLNYLISHLII